MYQNACKKGEIRTRGVNFTLIKNKVEIDNLTFLIKQKFCEILKQCGISF